jgi:hypothetical protein
MADISAIFGSLLIFGIAFPGLLMTGWLLFPASVGRARARLELTPWRCFWFGLIMTVLAAIPIIILLALPFGPAKFLGWVLLFLILAVSVLGSAGIVLNMSESLMRKSNASPAVAFLMSAIVLELAVFFPLIGWFLVFPGILVSALGATGFALLRWAPRVTPAPAVEPQLAPAV